MSSITIRQVRVDLFSDRKGFHFTHEGQNCVLPSMDKVHAFFQERCFDTVKLCQDGKKSYVHFGEGEIFYTKKALRRTISQENSGAWVEEKEGKKRYFVNESGWFQTSFKEVSKKEYFETLESTSSLAKSLGIAISILALAPSICEFARRLPFGTKEAGLGLLALQQKSPLLATFGYSLIPESANAQAMGTEFQVNTYTINYQKDPSVASLNDGGFVVTWESIQVGSDYDIYGQRYDSAGVPNSPEFQVNTYTTSDQRHPSVASLNDGGFVVTWERGISPNIEIYGQLFNVTGAHIGAEFQVNSYTANTQEHPSATSLNDRGFLVSWDSLGQDGDLDGIYGQRYDTNGTRNGTEFQINTYAVLSQSFPRVAPLIDGGFFVAWQSRGRDGDGWGIYGRRYDATGIPYSSEFQINSYTSGEQQKPSTAPLNDGGFVVIWQSEGQDGDLDGIFGKRYDATGIANGSEFQVNTYTTGSQLDPNVAPLNDGGFVVSWYSDGQDGDSYGIYGQRYDASGARTGIEFQINSYTTSSQQYPSIASLNDGGFVIIWESQGQDGDSPGIYGQRYDINGTAIPLNNQTSINSASTNVPSSQWSPSSSSTTGNSALSSSSISTTSSSSRGAPQTTASIPSNQVVSSATAILPQSSTSGMQGTSLSDSSFPSGFQIPVLIEVVYGESYSIVQNGQVIGSYTISGGSGQFNISNSNVLNIQLDPNYVPEEGDSITLFSFAEGQGGFEDGLILEGIDYECLVADGESPQNNLEYQIIFRGASSCITAAPKIFATIAPIIIH